MDFWIPKKHTLPVIPIMPEKPGDMPVLVFDFGTLDGHQFQEIAHKVKEERQKPRRLLVPRHVAITRLRDKSTKKIVGYHIEQEVNHG